MIQTSADYKEAINAPSRRIVPKATIDLTDPDLTVSSVSGDVDSTYSFPAQLYDRDSTFSGLVYATLETNRWLLDGGQAIMPNTPSSRMGEQGVWGDTLSDSDCLNGTSLIITMGGVDTLQRVTVAWTDIVCDGVPVTMTLKLYSNGTLLHESTENVSGYSHIFECNVIQPTDMELIVDEWSLPERRYRFVEFLAGVIETWGGETIFSMNIIQKADFSNLTMPYSSASLVINNTDKRFDPSNKQGVFNSVTARQPVPLFCGVEIGESVEYVPCGIYYQQDEGWSLENDGLTIRWDLIDIIGLLVDRKFELIGSQPTKLSGWISELVGQLGFTGQYTIDGNLGNTSLTCNASDIANITCGDLLRYVCQAANCYAVSDPVTGYLHIKSLGTDSKDNITMRMQNSVAGSQANTDIAFLVYDIGGVQYNVAGTEEISDKTVNIKNPFITTTSKATQVSQVILTQYGGDVLDLRVRGDMSREVGDVVTVEVNKGVDVAARIVEQTLSLTDGIMTNLPMKCLQANGAQMYTNYILITESGTYTMPSGITQISLVLIGGGQGGQGGAGGTSWAYGNWQTEGDGYGGQGGKGGKVYSTPLTINDGQTFTVVIGAGGAGGAGSPVRDGSVLDNDPPIPGEMGQYGGDTTATFSTTFSSASGVYMDAGYADLLTKKTYALPGVAGRDGMRPPIGGNNGLANRGFGGNGGDGGDGWANVVDYEDTMRVIGYPVPGADGGNGGSGAVLIFYAR